MRKSRFSEDQIIGILKEHQAGIPVVDLCRKHGISDATCLTRCGRSTARWKAPTPAS
jgi:putative transposase